ncbi:hypothetical protein [Streptomyces niveus]|uniref:Uncharacterized protein n=1 Tax=Streptomyces niveus TaxID=193462 RepID=A0A1U9R1G2_STRNV|nr:hypothetical protein [Streptomyces niveus]AQU70260.1 hypothetical protein BBN63_32845 [Streptomyces niveus]
MRAVLVSLVAAVSVLGLAGAAPAAERATGDVVIYSTELQPLNVLHNPEECHQLSPTAHQISNQTDKPVTMYQFPGCVGPEAWTLKPGFGVHTAGMASFKVGE